MEQLRKKILLIDNDEAMGQIFINQCQARPALEAYYIPRGGLVMPFLLIKPADVIIVDLGLPDVDGMSVIKEIRKNERLYNFTPAKIIVYTGYPLTDTVEGERIKEILADEGVAQFITKPYDLGDLIDEAIR
jgi:CheY-like chemotaxis protein